MGEGGEPHVSVRAMILSVIRFGIAAAEPTYMIEKGWAAYRKQKELDLYGKGLATSPPTSRDASIHKSEMVKITGQSACTLNF